MGDADYKGPDTRVPKDSSPEGIEAFAEERRRLLSRWCKNMPLLASTAREMRYSRGTCLAPGRVQSLKDLVLLEESTPQIRERFPEVAWLIWFDFKEELSSGDTKRWAGFVGFDKDFNPIWYKQHLPWYEQMVIYKGIFLEQLKKHPNDKDLEYRGAHYQDLWYEHQPVINRLAQYMQDSRGMRASPDILFLYNKELLLRSDAWRVERFPREAWKLRFTYFEKIGKQQILHLGIMGFDKHLAPISLDLRSPEVYDLYQGQRQADIDYSQ